MLHSTIINSKPSSRTNRTISFPIRKSDYLTHVLLCPERASVTLCTRIFGIFNGYLASNFLYGGPYDVLSLKPCIHRVAS